MTLDRIKIDAKEETQSNCAFCRGSLGKNYLHCPSCHVVVHEACFRERFRDSALKKSVSCVTLGCKQPLADYLSEGSGLSATKIAAEEELQRKSKRRAKRYIDKRKQAEGRPSRKEWPNWLMNSTVRVGIAGVCAVLGLVIGMSSSILFGLLDAQIFFITCLTTIFAVLAAVWFFEEIDLTRPIRRSVRRSTESRRSSTGSGPLSIAVQLKANEEEVEIPLSAQESSSSEASA